MNMNQEEWDTEILGILRSGKLHLTTKEREQLATSHKLTLRRSTFGTWYSVDNVVPATVGKYLIFSDNPWDHIRLGSWLAQEWYAEDGKRLTNVAWWSVLPKKPVMTIK